MLIIGDPPDLPIRCNIEPNDSFNFPHTVPEIEENDRGLAVHLAQCQPPRRPHSFVHAKVARIGEAARESIGNEQAGIGADQFAQSIPVAPVEPLDVKPQDLLMFRR